MIETIHRRTTLALVQLILVILFCSPYSIAQGISINTAGTAADTSAMLDVGSSEKGLLIPRMTQAQRQAITLPATGLLLFQTDGTSGFYYNAGTTAVPNWVVLNSATAGGSSQWNTLGPSINYTNTGNVSIGTTSIGSAKLNIVHSTSTSGSSTVSIKNTAGGGVGVLGEAFYTAGDFRASGGNGAGVYGESKLNATNSVTYGVYGVSSGSGATSKGYGVYGLSTGATEKYGVFGITTTGNKQYPVYGLNSSNNYGILGYHDGSTSYAGYFSGNVTVVGLVSKSGGSFKIDHPLDPENKFLYHSFVESPDMLNIYNGNIMTDASGDASVQLPSYFQALNIEFKYQLTVIGQFAQAIVSQEVVNNQFSIKTDKPNVKVSWQVTGVRNDPYAQQHRIAVEVEKTGEERGKYLIPELYGASPEKAIQPKPKKEDFIQGERKRTEQ